MRHLTMAVLLVPAACGGGSGAEATIDVFDFAFEPTTIQVEPGSTVGWTNGDDVLHTVTSGETVGPDNEPDGRFDGQLPEDGSTFSRTFDEPGTYHYFCTQHNIMRADVIVTTDDG